MFVGSFSRVCVVKITAERRNRWIKNDLKINEFSISDEKFFSLRGDKFEEEKVLREIFSFLSEHFKKTFAMFMRLR